MLTGICGVLYEIPLRRGQPCVFNGSFFFPSLDPGPGIPQADRSVEHQLPRRRIRIHTEVAQSFELIPRAGRRVPQARLDLAAGQPL